MMIKPQQKIFLIWSTTALTSTALLVSALGVYKNFDQLNTLASAGFFLLGILAFWLKYKWPGFVGILLGFLYNPEMSVSLPRHVWVIIDLVSIYAMLHFAHWATNPYKKGIRFEKYVSSLFPEPNFILENQSRDSSKSFGRKVESDNNPDLVLRSQRSGKVFAIECKWRGRWWQDQNGKPGLWWKKDEWSRYAKYGKDNNMPVYVALGIGGSPEQPKEVYFLETDKLNSLFLTQASIRSGYSPAQIIDIVG